MNRYCPEFEPLSCLSEKRASHCIFPWKNMSPQKYLIFEDVCIWTSSKDALYHTLRVCIYTLARQIIKCFSAQLILFVIQILLVKKDVVLDFEKVPILLLSGMFIHIFIFSTVLWVYELQLLCYLWWFFFSYWEQHLKKFSQRCTVI